MMNLSLGPPQQGLGPSPSHSSERIFDVEVGVEGWGVTSRSDEGGKDGDRDVEGEGGGVDEGEADGKLEADEPDFSITHPAPPPPPVVLAKPSSSSSTSSASASASTSPFIIDAKVQLPSVTSQLPQAGLGGHDGFGMGFHGKKGTEKEKRRGLEGECWWENEEASLYM